MVVSVLTPDGGKRALDQSCPGPSCISDHRDHESQFQVISGSSIVHQAATEDQTSLFYIVS